MKISKKSVVLAVVLCLLPCLLGIYLWDQLPAQLPTHFGLNNEANQYSSKAFAVFGIPVFMAVITLVCVWGLGKDPKHARQSAALQTVCAFIPASISCILGPCSYFIALGKTVNITLVVCVFLGIVFVVIGNYLPKCRRNYTMGIKLPWTLADDNNWNYTHRIGGICFIAAGFVMILTALFGKAWLIFVAVGIAVLIPCIASYLYYKKHKGEQET